MRSRFAPSPTGDLHLGGAYVALAAWLRARAVGGTFVVRMEDLDPPRVVPGAADRILDDLEWLGLAWDEGPRIGGPHAPYEQSKRSMRYEAAIASLQSRDLVYPCTCTRAEIARTASAPHAGEEGPRYPGTCRDPRNRVPGRRAAMRLRVPDELKVVTFEDEIHGTRTEDVAATVGDFVLARADGIASYQLAVVVDDLEMAIDEVVRGDDLLSSTGRQVLLAQLLGGRAPRWVHLPMVLGPDGDRLAKRHQLHTPGAAGRSKVRGSTVSELRGAGFTRETLLGELGVAFGLFPAARDVSLPALVEAARRHPVRRETPWMLPDRFQKPARNDAPC